MTHRTAEHRQLGQVNDHRAAGVTARPASRDSSARRTRRISAGTLRGIDCASAEVTVTQIGPGSGPEPAILRCHPGLSPLLGQSGSGTRAGPGP